MSPKTIFQFAISAGGVKRHVLDLCLGLDANRFRCVGIFPDKLMCQTVLQDESSKYQQTFRKYHLACRTLEVPRHIDIPKIIIAALRLAALLRSENAMVLHCHSTMAGFVGRLACLLAPRCRLVYTHHSPYFLLLEGKKRRFFRMIEKLLLYLTDAVIAVSDSEYRDLRRELGTDFRMALIRNGVDVEGLSSRVVDRAAVCSSLGIAPKSKILLSPARLEYPKDNQTLIAAMQRLSHRHPDVVAVFAGEGPERKALESAAHAAGLAGKALFLGWRDDLMDIMAACDVIVLSSFGEGLPYALLEASAMKKPLVGSICRGIVDIIRHETNGFLFPLGDAAALSGYLDRLFSDSDLSRRMGENGFAHISRDFNRISMVRQTGELYDTLF